MAGERRDRLVLTLAEAQCSRNGSDDEVRVRDGGEQNRDHPVGELVRDFISERERQSGLPDSAGAGQREQSHLLADQQLTQGHELLLTADQLPRWGTIAAGASAGRSAGGEAASGAGRATERPGALRGPRPTSSAQVA